MYGGVSTKRKQPEAQQTGRRPLKSPLPEECTDEEWINAVEIFELLRDCKRSLDARLSEDAEGES